MSNKLSTYPPPQKLQKMIELKKKLPFKLISILDSTMTVFYVLIQLGKTTPEFHSSDNFIVKVVSPYAHA